MSSKKRIIEEEVEDTFSDVSAEPKKKKKKNKNKNKEKENISEEVIKKEEEKESKEEDAGEEAHELYEPHEAENEQPEEWPREDIIELIKRMETQIPEKDNLRYTSRSEKLNWNKVQFGSYSSDDCYKKWKSISKKVRSYRLLHEVLDDAKVWAEKPWTDFYSRGKKKRHPDHPARPLSSYMLFYMAQKNKVAKRNPDMKMTEISKIIGVKYNSLPEHKKAYYIETAKMNQEAYRKELDKFYQKHPEEIPKTKKTDNPKKNRRDAGAPVKPLTPFKLFYNNKYEKHKSDEGFDQHTFLEKCKEQWKNLSGKKKTIWIKWALEEEAKYSEDMAAYSSVHSEEVPPHPAKSILTKEEKVLLDRMSGKPEKPPNSAYSLYSRIMLQRSDMKNDTPRDRMKEIARQWALVSPQEKLKYAEKVKHMLETYKLEFANYLESLPPEKRAEELEKNQPKRKASSKPKSESGKEQVKKKGKEPTRTLYKGEPEPPPTTVFEFFLKQYTKENSHLSPRQSEIQAAAHWKQLSQSEKDKYQRKHEQAKSKYLAQYETFIHSLNEAELKEYSAMKSKWGKMTASSDYSEDSEEDSEGSSDEKESDKGQSSDGSNVSDSE